MNDSHRLNLTDAEIERASEHLLRILRNYESSLPTSPILPELNRPALSDLLTEPFAENGIGIDRLFELIERTVIPNSTTVAHPRFLAYVLGPPNGIAPFAEAIAATLNQNCNFWQLSPAANVIERKVLAWLCGLFDYPSTAGGIVTSGGSVANLVALSTAINDKCGTDFRKTGLQSLAQPLVVYTSTEAHRCIEKDAVILGLGLDNIRKIPVNEAFQMRVDLLREAVVADRKAGKRPFCVVAAGGTINTGAVDPIAELAALCAEEDLWLHVDGAYGALFVLSDQAGALLKLCGAADSIALDPHKLLFAPLEAGCLIVKDRQKLHRAFSFSASYLTADEDPLLNNFMDYGPQLSRGFKAFKIWCALQAFGVQAFARACDHMLTLARHMGERILAQPELELMAPVTLSAVCFRHKQLDAAGHQRLLTKLIEERTALLGPVNLNGTIGIRACVTNYRTTQADIDLVVERLLGLGR